jgi:endo-1,4-beta-mannosidase
MGLYGHQSKKTAATLKKKGLYTHFGTDLHSREGIRYLKDWKSVPNL